MKRESILQLIDRLDKKLEGLENQVSKYDHKALNRKPNDMIWSPLQVMHHLMISEKKSLQYVKKKLSYNPSLPKVGIGSFLRSQILYLFIKSPIKFPAAPGVGTEFLPEEESLEELIHMWYQERKSLREYVSGMDEKWLDRAVYKHPFVGRISAKQMLMFFDAHFDWHTKQVMKRLII